jgi:hypothetical protein
VVIARLASWTGWSADRLDRLARSWLGAAPSSVRSPARWTVDELRHADEVVEAAQRVGRARAGADRDDVDAQAGGTVEGWGGAALVFVEPAGSEQP